VNKLLGRRLRAGFAGCPALNSWAAQQHRITDGVKIFVMHPPREFPAIPY